MQKLRAALEHLHEDLEGLELAFGEGKAGLEESLSRQAEALKLSRGREAHAMALAQKVAARLDQAIARVERVLKD